MNSSNFEPMQLLAVISQFNYVLHEKSTAFVYFKPAAWSFLMKLPRSCIVKKATSNFPVTFSVPFTAHLCYIPAVSSMPKNVQVFSFCMETIIYWRSH